MINRKIILSSVIAGVVSLSASHHVTAALPNFQQGQEGVHVTLVNKKVLDDQGAFYNSHPIKKIEDTNSNFQVQIFYNKEDLRLPTSKEDENSKIRYAVFKDITGFAKLGGALNYQYSVEKTVASYGKFYQELKFTNVSMDINTAMAIPLGEKNGKDALHYREVDGVNRFYLDKNETQEIVITLLEGIANGTNNVDFLRFHRVEILPDGMFFLRKNIESVTLSESIKVIPSDSFRGCIALKTINLGHVTSLGDRAFYNCQSLQLQPESLKNVKHISKECFSGCKLLTLLDLQHTTSLGDRAFYNCQNLQLPRDSLKNIKHISKECFRDCRSLTLLDLQHVTSLGDMAFFNCQKLELHPGSLKNVKHIPDVCFCGCESLTRLDLQHVTSFGSGAFRNCQKLELHPSSLKNVKYIPDACFSGCESLTLLDLQHVTSFGSGSFRNCQKLQLDPDSLKNAKKIGCEAFGYFMSTFEYLMNKSVQTPELDLRNVSCLGWNSFEHRGLQKITLSSKMRNHIAEIYRIDRYSKFLLNFVE